MADAIVNIFRIRTPDDEYVTPDCSNCAIRFGYDAHKTGGDNIPLRPVPLFGEPPKDAHADVTANQQGYILSIYGFLFAASEYDEFPMPPEIKAVLEESCGKCKLGENCSVLYNLEREE